MRMIKIGYIFRETYSSRVHTTPADNRSYRFLGRGSLCLARLLVTQRWHAWLVASSTLLFFLHNTLQFLSFSRKETSAIFFLSNIFTERNHDFIYFRYLSLSYGLSPLKLQLYTRPGVVVAKPLQLLLLYMYVYTMLACRIICVHCPLLLPGSG